MPLTKPYTRSCSAASVTRSSVEQPDEFETTLAGDIPVRTDVRIRDLEPFTLEALRRACLKAYLASRIDDGSGLLFTGQKGPLHRWALNRIFVELLKNVSDARVARGLKRIPQGCFRFHTLKHSVATIIANRVQNIFTLKNHLGHASISSSMSYAHPDPGLEISQALY